MFASHFCNYFVGLCIGANGINEWLLPSGFSIFQSSLADFTYFAYIHSSCYLEWDPSFTNINKSEIKPVQGMYLLDTVAWNKEFFLAWEVF